MRQEPPARLRPEGKVVFLEGDLTLAQAASMLDQCKAAVRQGAEVIDLSRLGHMDSSAISLILSLRRFSQAQGRSVEIRAIPESLLSLANLYGVAEHLQTPLS